MGRTEEMGAMIKVLSNVVHGMGATIMVGGEAGIGKTRLFEEIASLAQSSGFRIYLGRCLPGFPYSYMPFRQAFMVPRDNKIEGTDYLVAAFDELVRVGASQTYSDQSSLRDRIQLSTLDFLKREAAISPVLVAIEDLQWSDGPSLQLLQFLSRNIGNSRIAILGNYRSEDLVPLDRDTSHPLKEALRAMESDEGFTTMHLGPLDEKGTVDAIEGLLGGAIDLPVGYKIYRESGGNPLFALETTLLLTKGGDLIDVGGTWKPVDQLSVRMPTTVKEVMLRRLDHVPSSVRRILDVASVIGTEFQPDVILDIFPIERANLDDGLASLEVEHQLILRDGRKFRFRHARLRDVVYDSISAIRKRELHARIGRSLESRGGPDALPGPLSYHFFNARLWDRCLQYSLLAGDDLLQRFSAVEALPYYLRAREALDRDPSLREERARVVEGLADAYQESLDFARADELYIEVLPLIKDNNGRARILRKRMWCWDHDRLGNGTLDMQKRLIDEGLAIADIELLERAEILSCKSNAILQSGDAEQAQRISEEAICIFRDARAMPRLAWELIYCGYIDLSMMRFEKAVIKLAEARSILKEHPWLLAENNADQHMGRIMIYQGRSSEAVELFTRSLDRSLQLGEYRVAGIACYYLALVHEEENDLEGTEQWIDKGLKYASQGGYRPQMAMLELLLAHIAVLDRDVRKAEALLQAAEDLYSGVDRSIRNFASGMLMVGKGEVLTLKGHDREGKMWIERGLREIMEVPNGAFYEAVVRRWYGDLMASVGMDDLAKEQYRMSAEKYESLSNINWTARLRNL